MIDDVHDTHSKPVREKPSLVGDKKRGGPLDAFGKQRRTCLAAASLKVFVREALGDGVRALEYGVGASRPTCYLSERCSVSHRLRSIIRTTEVFLLAVCRAAAGTERNIVLLQMTVTVRQAAQASAEKRASSLFKATVNLLMPFLLRVSSVFIKII